MSLDEEKVCQSTWRCQESCKLNSKVFFFLNLNSGILWHVESDGCRLDPQTTVTERDRGLGAVLQWGRLWNAGPLDVKSGSRALVLNYKLEKLGEGSKLRHLA